LTCSGAEATDCDLCDAYANREKSENKCVCKKPAYSKWVNNNKNKDDLDYQNLI